MIGCMILAIVPGIVIIKYMKSLNPDKNAVVLKEFRYLIAGITSVIIASIIEDLLSTVFLEYCAGNLAMYDLIDNFIVTAVTEELVKLLGFFIVFSKFAKNFDFGDELAEIRIVSCMFFTGMGFAIAENVMYALDGDLWVMFFRMIFCLTGHGMYAVFMGEFYYKYKVNGKLSYAVSMLFIPVLFHGAYDLCVGSENGWLILFAAAYEIYLYVIVFKKLCVLSAHSFEESFAYNLYIN